jgi:hypothetical protein
MIKKYEVDCRNLKVDCAVVKVVLLSIIFHEMKGRVYLYQHYKSK